MRRRIAAAASVAVALSVATGAAAKGPESAKLTGPGLEQRSLTFAGSGEMGQGTPLGTLVDATGFFAQMYGQTPDPTLKTRPRGTLGPQYRITYVVPGPNGIRSRVVQHVYPFAKPTPLTYISPTQRYWGGRLAHGGWFRSTIALRQALRLHR
jgi:hypothetical protein